MINEIRVKCFLRVAELLNFTEVGKQMFISQQTVSKHIADFEKDVGFQLVDRNHHYVKLTKEGEAFYRFFNEALSAYEALVAQLKDCSSKDLAMDIRIGYQAWIKLGSAPKHAMNALRHEYPNLNFFDERYSPSTLLKLLEDGSLDAIMLHKRFIPKKANFHIMELCRLQMQLIVSGDNPLNSETADYMTFHNEPLIIDSWEGEPKEITVRRAEKDCKQYGFMPSCMIILPNRDSLFTAAQLNKGVFFASNMSQIPDDMHFFEYPTNVPEVNCFIWKKGHNEKTLLHLAEQLRDEYNLNNR